MSPDVLSAGRKRRRKPWDVIAAWSLIAVVVIAADVAIAYGVARLWEWV